MAEVSHRLVRSAAYRLAFFRTNLNYLICFEESTGCFLINCCSSYSPVKEEPDQDEGRTLSKTRCGSSEKLYRLHKAEYQHKYVTFFDTDSFSLSSSRLIWCNDAKQNLQANKSDLQKNLLACRMLPWIKTAVFIPPDTFRSPQQIRAFSTALFTRTEDGAEELNGGRRPLRLHPEFQLRGSTTRGYSWKSEETVLLHRSKTAYYDILKVSPNATQSQIKTAYYKQSFIYHPDKNPGSKEAVHRFSEIREAYTVLGNISLRRKYDQGFLNQFDIQSAGRPSSKETTSKSKGSHQHPRARHVSQTSGKPMFDFDAFYQAHYGEQLQRERAMRAKKNLTDEKQKQIRKWRQQKMNELTMVTIMIMVGIIMISFRE